MRPATDPWQIVAMLVCLATILDLALMWLGVSGEPYRSAALIFLMASAFLVLRLPARRVHDRPPFFLSALPPVAAMLLAQVLSATLARLLHWRPALPSSPENGFFSAVLALVLLGLFVPPLAQWHRVHAQQPRPDELHE